MSFRHQQSCANRRGLIVADNKNLRAKLERRLYNAIIMSSSEQVKLLRYDLGGSVIRSAIAILEGYIVHILQSCSRARLGGCL